MFRRFREASESLSRIALAVESLGEGLHALATDRNTDESLASRVAALELELERRHAEAEGLLLKAKGKFDAARAAEERARRLAPKGDPESDEESDLDEDAILEAYAEAGIPLGDAPGGEGEGMQPVRGGMASRAESKRSAYAMKWSRG